LKKPTPRPKKIRPREKIPRAASGFAMTGGRAETIRMRWPNVATM
jgi:hypothetical protein